LGERNAALEQPGGVLVPQVVPVQVEVTEPLLALGSEVLVAPLAPARGHSVRLQNGHHPPLLECLQLLANLVAEYRDIVGHGRLFLPSIDRPHEPR
jgi:hypothetical protein